MLQGREDERARVDALLADAAAGRGGALVLRGHPGVGKSALLADAVARAEGMTVLRTQGIESESPLAFAALQRLLRPALGCTDRLPAPQSTALRAAFGEIAAGDADRFLVFLAVLSLLAEAGEQAPVLAVVDDAHWLDDASAAALLFVARRLQDERVALLFAARHGDVREFDGGDLPGLVLAGIDPVAAGALLAERAGVPVPVDVSRALVEGTGGNPLALLELTDALPARQLTGAEPLPARLPLTTGVERAFLDRYRRLPASAQAVLLAAAADDSGRLTTVRAAAGALGADDEGWAAAERSGLVRVQDGSVDLRHPLVRSAVYGAVTSVERRRVHHALAATMTGAADADRRAWHLAASVDRPDEAVVAELDRAAERAVHRGGHEAASASWERAAELSEGEARAERLHRAASSAWTAAQPQRARVLAEAGLALVPRPTLRADLRRLQGHIEFNTGSLDTGYRIVVQAAAEVAASDARRSADLAMLGAALAAVGARSAGVRPGPAELVRAVAPDAPVHDRCLADLTRGLDAVSRRAWAEAAPAISRTIALADELDDDADSELLVNVAVATWYVGDDAAALRLQGRLLAAGRAAAAPMVILHALTRRAFSEITTGNWRACTAGATESLLLAENSGQPALAALPHALLALVAALRGGADGGEHLAAAERIAAERSLGVLAGLVRDLVRWTRGALADGDAALHQFAQIGLPTVRQMAAVDRLEAAVRAGRRDAAADWVAELAAFADPTGTGWAHASVEHGRALLADGEVAGRHFERALEHHARSLRAPDRARTELAYGAFLRRARRRVDARAHLRAALETFEDLRAETWAERARQELRASGETARRRDISAATTPELTPQERQVAALVREGLSNRDVAARLFLSPRTVDFHLRNVFAKLGVTSRTELVALALDT
ncbi:LuxR family transcriptional regulator [Geodermatophilus sp. YIM 151500]|uniref:helix-turn-helix transcriptional regulator n=1 Tax=Geodermatophilus sp. YIM 151500 TaxID=2984531 RepID=UPI0021E4E0D5|nr:LuxR family transcriptional regulator [Geodermatophilus sp. YIM 151500]MCV2491818.1 LuxR family transcriptional regulator [Geodermatophilus sp. YIM 151500]